MNQFLWWLCHRFLLHGLSGGRTILITENLVLKKIKFVVKLVEMLKVAQNHLQISLAHPHLQYSLALCRIATRQEMGNPFVKGLCHKTGPEAG